MLLVVMLERDSDDELRDDAPILSDSIGLVTARPNLLRRTNRAKDSGHTGEASAERRRARYAGSFRNTCANRCAADRATAALESPQERQAA
uniref:hypothetical protein n=1 Tax=Burkholderia diffusa TaxID=488732 RepID=UPI001CC82DF7|nr:hypothetical protein [Burkholderia diffusa]